MAYEGWPCRHSTAPRAELAYCRGPQGIPRPGSENGNCQTSADASNTQLVSPVARASKWLGGAKATRLFMSQ